MKNLRRWAVGFIVAVATWVGILGFQSQASAQTELTLEAAQLSLEELADGVYGVLAMSDFPPTDPAKTAICNGGIIVGSDGVLVIDPFQNEDLANLLFATVASLTDQPIRYVLNTHYHFDHSGGNAAAEALDYPIFGRGPIREFMLTRNLDLDPNPTPPSVVVNGMDELWLGDRTVQLIEFEGHSGGTDLVAYVPDVDVLVAGDLLFTQRIPYITDGNIRLWQDNLDQMATAYASATILPGHGDISSASDFDALKEYLEYLEAIALGWQEQGLSQEEAIAQTNLPEQYESYLAQALFTGNLETAYQQITLGQDDVASIEAYFAAQSPELQAL